MYLIKLQHALSHPYEWKKNERDIVDKKQD